MKKWLIVIGGLAVVLGGIVGLKAVQIGSLLGFLKEAEAVGYPPTPVSTRTAEAEEWEETLRFTGTLRAVQGVTLTAEVGGTVAAIQVENGAKVKAGQPLLELDATEEEAELASVRARLRLAELNLERTKGLLEKRIIAESEFDATQAAYDEVVARVENLQALLAKKVVLAPFDGQAGIRVVNLGQTLAVGDALLPVHSSDPIYVEFAVPQTRLAGIQVGQEVRVESDGLTEAVTGEITAINPMIDEASRTARVQGILRNEAGILRPGQFAVVDVVLPEKREVVAIPASALVAAAYGDSVFVVEESEGRMIARQQFVRTNGQRGDFVAVSRGLKAGDRVVSAGAFKLTNGMPVAIDDTMQPEPKMDPRMDNS